MIKGFNIWMINFKFNWISYDWKNESCVNIFFLQKQQIKVRLVTITIEFDSTLAYTPFILREHSL